MRCPELLEFIRLGEISIGFGLVALLLIMFFNSKILRMVSESMEQLCDRTSFQPVRVEPRVLERKTQANRLVTEIDEITLLPMDLFTQEIPG